MKRRLFYENRERCEELILRIVYRLLVSLYLYVCTCMCTCIGVYLYVCTCMYVLVCMYLYMCTCMYVFACVYLYVCTSMYILIYVYLYVCLHVCTCMCVLLCMYVDTSNFLGWRICWSLDETSSRRNKKYNISCRKREFVWWLLLLPLINTLSLYVPSALHDQWFYQQVPIFNHTPTCHPSWKDYI